MKNMFWVVTCVLLTGICLGEKFNKVDLKISDIRIVVPQQCFHGDFDLLIHDHMSKSSKLFLSVKNVTTKKEHTFSVFENLFKEEGEDASKVREKVANLLTDGEVVSLTTNLFNEKGTFLISVCSDSSETPSCFKQKVKDLTELLAPYRDDKPDYIPEDHVFFRQVVKSDGKQLIMLAEPLNQTNLEDAKKEFGKDANFSDLDILKSLPPQKINTSLVIGMPVFSPKKCGGEQQK